MNCTEAETQMSEYLDGVLSGPEIVTLELHISSCVGCLEMRNGMEAVTEWGHGFPGFASPEWLATRILVNTPQTQREAWRSTSAGIGRWVLDTRTAMAVFTASVMLGWMTNAMGVSLEPAQLRNLQAIYYSVDDLIGDAYDRVV